MDCEMIIKSVTIHYIGKYHILFSNPQINVKKAKRQVTKALRKNKVWYKKVNETGTSVYYLVNIMPDDYLVTMRISTHTKPGRMIQFQPYMRKKRVITHIEIHTIDALTYFLNTIKTHIK